jgi:hypothetical protein
VCAKSPAHDGVQAAVARAALAPRGAQPLVFVPNASRRAGLVFRTDANSNAFAQGFLTEPRPC